MKRLTILNRDFQHPSDGWYHIEAKGEFPNARSKVVQVIDDESCQAMADTFNREADATPNFAGMLVDHEHFKHDEDKETRAYGWLTRLQNRKDGLYGQIRWSGTGQKAVDEGDYRFFSTEYDPKDFTVLNDAKPRKVRPMRLDGLTLTNDPNNKKGQKPITNRDGDKPMDDTNPDPLELSKTANALSKVADKDGSAELHQSAAAAHERAADCHNDCAKDAAKEGDERTAKMHAQLAAQHDIEAGAHKAKAKAQNRISPGSEAGGASQTQIENTEMKTVIKALGLPADATEADVLAGVTKITNRVTELETAQVESDLEVYKDRYPAELKDAIKLGLTTNRAATIEGLKKAPQRVSGGRTAPAAVHNRNAQTTADAERAADEVQVGEVDERKQRTERNKLIGDYKLKNRCSHDVATSAILQERPDLFGIEVVES